MLLRNWLSLLLLTGWACAQELVPARSSPLPRFPRGLLLGSTVKSAVLEVTVRPDGSILVRMSEPSSDAKFNRRLVKFLEDEWRWTPASRDRKAVSSRQTVKIKWETE